jgi:DNA-binding winged helix-turn-helix (wHTH) protein
MKRSPLVAMPRVGKPDEPLCCWVCQQRWPSRYDLVVDATAFTIRIDDRQPLALTRNELHVASALISAFPRWLTRSQLIEHAWDYRPDCDMPGSTSISKAIKSLGQLLRGTRYTIENSQQRGVRLVDVDTILREMRLEEIIEGAARVKQLHKTLQSVSQHVAQQVAAPKAQLAAAKPKKKSVRAAREEVHKRKQATYRDNSKKVHAKRARNVKRRLEAHV